MTSEEKMTMDRHTEALEAHTRALNNLTSFLTEIFTTRNLLNGEVNVHPLDRTLASFIEAAETISTKNQLIAESNEATVDKLCRAVSCADEAASKMIKAANYNDEAADKMIRAASYR